MFSFACLLNFLEDEHDRLVVLLDEPGDALHGDAQRELVKLIYHQSGALKQFVYTTHSPFMVDADRLGDIRIADGSDVSKGAVVRSDIDSISRDSLLPLQSALGYSVLTPLMMGPNVLLVEGVSDLVYLRAWQSLMLTDDRTSLSDRWSIVPCGGIEKIPALLSFFYEKESLNLAVLCDGKPSKAHRIDDAVRGKLISSSHIVFLADHLGRKDADIEDMFNPGTFLRIFNETAGTDIKVDGLAKGPPRMWDRLKQSDAIADGNVQVESFHYRCARSFERSAERFYHTLTDSEKQRIEGLFKRLNSMLKDDGE